MNVRLIFGCLLVMGAWWGTGLARPAAADPCGMVPPIYQGPGAPITRVGLQQTYVFYKDGVETFVIRPGFTGKVDQFGMLIPFPSPPAIRKVPDHVFDHLAAAVDPPEVVIDLTIKYRFARKYSYAKNKNEKSNGGLEFDDGVKVLKQEAVGMYEVAVLEAGSAKALKRWMDDHGYQYPEGMDEACNDYVDLGWCFVAVKTKVAQKEGVDPHPGQRTVKADLPEGSTFDGHVQGMGFRFRVDDLIVPMRLSTFNRGELRNVVYLLTEGPRKIRMIPEEYVVRQLDGERLFKNLTEPLPVWIIGGTEADISEQMRTNLVAQRDPVPRNGAAAELFATDVLACDTEDLSLQHEEDEKQLLQIGERFGLRGPDIDKLHADALAEPRKQAVTDALGKLKELTLTVVDGDFPRHLLRSQNLTFAQYQMPVNRNQPKFYDAKLNGPAPDRGGVLKVGALAPLGSPASDAKQAPLFAATGSSGGHDLPTAHQQLPAWAIGLFAVTLIGLGISVGRGKVRRWIGRCFFLLAIMLASQARADESSYYEKLLQERNIKSDAAGLNEYFMQLHPSEAQQARNQKLIEQLGTTDSFAQREDAMAKLLVLPQLPSEQLIAAANGPDPEVRWRAKTILELGKPESDRVLFAAFKTVEEKKLAGVMPELIRAIPLCDKAHLVFAAQNAVKTVATPSDAATLRQAISEKLINVRMAAIGGLGHALGEGAADDLYKLLQEPNDQIRLASARALADFGDRRCLLPLVELLSSDDLQVRSSSSLALRELSGKHFGYAAYDSDSQRKQAIEKWLSWVADEGKTAKLTFPLHAFGSGTSYLNGNTLLAYGGQNKVVEIDPTGKEVWSYPTAQNVWSAEKLANGNVLMAEHTGNRVIEVNPNKEIVWEYPSGYPLNAKLLDNGNILIAEWSGQRAVEVDRQKNVVWEFKVQGSCSDVHRLENGNTLISASGRPVIEVTPDGKTVWEYPVQNAYGCQPLPNGNVLIADFQGRVIEVNRNKDVVWEYTTPNPSDAFRLPNGNTLITSSTNFLEVTPDKKVIWSKDGASYGSARR